jgi:uncharacterized membrane protein YhaH (DUF805 family)
MNWYLSVLGNYAKFTGRARRSEFWYFQLFNFIFLIVAAILDNLFGTNFDMGYGVASPYGIIYLIYSLVVFLPSLAVSVRRLHDVGKSGWMLLVSFIPLVGAIWLIVLAVTDSQPGSNKWGENPKEIVD